MTWNDISKECLTNNIYRVNLICYFTYCYNSVRFHCNVYYILHIALVTHYIVIYLHKCNILLIYICAQDTTLIYISIIPFEGLIIIKLKKFLLANAQIKLLQFKYWNYFLLRNVWWVISLEGMVANYIFRQIQTWT